MRQPTTDRSARSSHRRPVRLAITSPERLEDRRLMAAGIREFALDSQAHSPISDVLPMSDGSVWFTGYNQSSGTQNGVWKRSSDGTVSEIAELASLSNARELAKGPDGTVWILSGGYNEGGRVTRVNNSGLAHFPVNGVPEAIAFGTDGTLAIAVNRSAFQSTSSIVRMTSDGASTSLATTGERDLTSLIVSTDGDVWFTDSSSKVIDRINSRGTVSTFPIESSARQLTLGPDGAMWYATATADGQGALGRLMENGGTLVYPLGSRTVVTGLVPTADGAVWYTDGGLDVVAKLAPSGQITTIPTPTDRSEPQSLVSDGAGGFWFVNDGYRLGRVSTDLPEPSLRIAAQAFVAPEGPLNGDVLVASFTTSDPLATPGDFIARVDLGTGSSQSLNGEIRFDGPGRFLVMAPRGRQNDFGTALMTVTVLDVRNHNAVGRASTLLGVAKFDVVLPVVTNPRSSTVTAGATHEIILADLTDEFSSGILTGSIDWGDGSTSDASFVIVGSTVAGFSVKGTHRYATPGTYTVTTTVLDNGQPVVATSTITVVPAPPLITVENVAQRVNEGQSVSQALIAFGVEGVESPVTSDFTATIDWGDGTAPSVGTIQTSDDGRFLVVGDHVYNLPGLQTATVTITHVGTNSTYEVQADVQVTPKPLPSFLPEANALKGVQGSAVAGIVATFFDYYYADMDDYSATVVWGDGSQSAGLVSTYQGQMIVYASHTYATAGKFATSVIVSKAGFANVSASSTADVAAKPVVAPVPVPPAPQPVKPSIVSARAFSAARGGATIVLNFSGTVDAVTVADASRYRVTDAGKDGKLGTKDDRVVKIRSAKFDADRGQLTLTPRGVFSRKSPFRVAVRGESVMTAAWVRAASSARTR